MLKPFSKYLKSRLIEQDSRGAVFIETTVSLTFLVTLLALTTDIGRALTMSLSLNDIISNSVRLASSHRDIEIGSCTMTYSSTGQGLIAAEGNCAHTSHLELHQKILALVTRADPSGLGFKNKNDLTITTAMYDTVSASDLPESAASSAACVGDAVKVRLSGLYKSLLGVDFPFGIQQWSAYLDQKTSTSSNLAGCTAPASVVPPSPSGDPGDTGGGEGGKGGDEGGKDGGDEIVSEDIAAPADGFNIGKYADVEEAPEVSLPEWEGELSPDADSLDESSELSLIDDRGDTLAYF